MGYAFEVVRVTISGTAWQGAEVWSTGFYLGQEAANAVDPTQAMADEIRAQWETFFTTGGVTSGISADYTTTAVKLAKHNVLGDVIDGKTVWANVQTPMTGNGTLSKVPPQVALVASLRSNLLHGLGTKGRMFLPPPGVDVDATGHIGTAVRDGIRDRLTTFFTNVAGHASIQPNRPILASQGSTPPIVGAPVNRLIKQVQIGNVFDTQRRRRNGLAEIYSSGTVVNP